MVEALKQMALLSNIQDNAINSPMALNQINRNFQRYTMMFNDFERRSKTDMNEDLV
jgi:hypothetical protein